MAIADTDKAFTGSIPECYERYLVPLIFAPYADDLATRVAALAPASVLEIACGTGVLTRRLASLLAPPASIVATDLNQPMLDLAAARGTARPVQWSQADAMHLPFADASVDVVVCQFGVMFFPDKAHAFAEARRVLKPGGAFLFNCWDSLEHNEHTRLVVAALATIFADDPPRFMERTPHAYHQPQAIAADLRAAGFSADPRIDTVALRSRAASARDVAIAFCQGTPLRNEITARAPTGLDGVTEQVAASIARVLGPGPSDAGLQALVCTVMRDAG